MPTFEEKWSALNDKLNVIIGEMAQVALDEYGIDPIPAHKHNGIVQMLIAAPEMAHQDSLAGAGSLYVPFNVKLTQLNHCEHRRVVDVTQERMPRQLAAGPVVFALVGICTAD